jgi:hypothetical protein
MALGLAVVIGAAAFAQQASPSGLSLNASCWPPEGWMKGGWGRVVVKIENHDETPARVVKWAATWEVKKETVGYHASDEDRVDLPPGEVTEIKKDGWLSPELVDAAKPDNVIWCGTFTVEASDGTHELTYRIPIPVAVLPEETVLLRGKHIGIELMKSRIEGFTAKDRVLRWLDECYEAMQDLTGYTPYGGELIIIKESPRNPVWAYSGNPVLMNTQYVGGLIEEMNAGLMPFGWVHELGHDFDIPEELYDDWYVWNGRVCEGMANFKLMYAYLTIPSRDWKAKWTFDKDGAFPAPAGGVLLDGKQFIEAAFLFEGDPYLADPSISYELDNTPSFMARLAYAYGWDLYRKWFRTYKRLAELGFDPPETAEDKISLMCAILSEAAGADLVPVFQRWRYPVTAESVAAMKERYPVEKTVKSIVLPGEQESKTD